MTEPKIIPSAVDRQKEIYTGGFAGHTSEIKIDLAQLEQIAKTKLTPQAFAYIAGGAGIEGTMLANRQSFDRYKIIPRMLVDVGVRDIGIELFGKKYETPFLIAPIGVLEMAHPDADLAVARAASALKIPYIFSNQASVAMEDTAAVMGNNPKWFQLYWSKSNDLVASLVARAEKSGCEAIAVTLDTTLLGWRTRDLDLAYLPFLEGKGIAQYTSDPVFQKMMDEEAGESPASNLTMQSLLGLIKMVKRYPGNGFFSKLRSGRPVKAVRKFIGTYSNPSTTWEDLKFLRAHTRLPIVLKGIQHPDDARKAMDFGMDGVIVSNHGGRQVDGAIGSFDALPGIVEAINEKIPVLFDSGVRGGADVFKALAMGAKGVCIGRPYVYGLAINGQQGVCDVLRNFMADFELTMGLSGCRNIKEITRDCLTK